jgi:hypothetical protein
MHESNDIFSQMLNFNTGCTISDYIDLYVAYVSFSIATHTVSVHDGERKNFPSVSRDT